MEVVGADRQSVAAEEKWSKALSKVFKGVVVLTVTATRYFDTEVAGVFKATGFIVDKKRGLILTNRHVVHPGPAVADATFLNNEEIPVYPLYRDPVHDFGFFRFDPAALRFMEIEEIPLAPQAAAIGLEIRVVGNDSGEKLSVSAGTLARLDRSAPVYSQTKYNDFNTFYMQAASGTKGGSSGSPVINCEGQAVGLNAGARQKSSCAYYLPLDRVVRTLQILQRCKDESGTRWHGVHIPRGTLQMTLLHKGFDQARRLGLQAETEELVRKTFPAETGILVIDSVVPGGPAENHLEPGDLLVRVNSEIVTHFLKLETILDDNVGKAIDLDFERGGVAIKVTLEVQDLHSITPNKFLELSDGIIHPLSYQQARNFSFNCGLVYVAQSGYMLLKAGVPSGAIIKKFAGKETTNVEEFISILSELHRGSRVPLEFVTHLNHHRAMVVLVTIDKHDWFGEPQLYTRNDETGLWKKMPAILPIPSSGDDHVGATEVYSTKLITSPGLKGFGSNVSDGGDMTHSGSFVSDPVVIDRGEAKKRLLNDQDEPYTTLEIKAPSAEEVIKPSLVMVEVHIPPSLLLDDVQTKPFSQTGVVVYHSKTLGIVAIDRNTVGSSVADVMLSFAAYQAEIPGQVVFLHPIHNYALVAYDPVALGPSGAAAVRAASLLPEPALLKGDVVHLVGLSSSLQPLSRKCVVTNPQVSLNISPTETPRYRAMNMDVIELESHLGNAFAGVLVDGHGRLQALWATFYMPMRKNVPIVAGIPIYAVSEVLERIIQGTASLHLLVNGMKISMPLVRVLEVELYTTLLSKARSFGLSDKWISELANKDPLREQVLQVKCCFAGSVAAGKLEAGDMLLAIDGKVVTNYRDVENACQLFDESNSEQGHLRLTVFRQGNEIEVLVGTDVRSGLQTMHMVKWCGYIIQETHSAVRSLGFWPPKCNGVYLSQYNLGSPADRYGDNSQEWIVQVNDKPTPDLQTFVDVIKELEHGDFVRVKIVNLDGKRHVFSLKQDLHYWPTWELKFDKETATWIRATIKSVSNDF